MVADPCRDGGDLAFRAMMEGLKRPRVKSDPRLRSGDESLVMEAAREIVAAGDDALREQREALAAEFEDRRDEVRDRLMLGLVCLVAVRSGKTPQEIRDWLPTLGPETGGER